MAVVWVGVVVFLVMLFAVVTPSGQTGYGGPASPANQLLTNQMQPGPQPDYAPRQSGMSCRQILALLFTVFLLVVAGVLLWSMSIQTGGGL